MSLSAIRLRLYRICPKAYPISRLFSITMLVLSGLLVIALVLQSKSNISSTKFEISASAGRYTYDRYSPLIFVGGLLRTGTTLMRSLLDTHQDIRCGEETLIIPKFMREVGDWVSSDNPKRRGLNEAGVTTDVILAASANFLLGVIVGHGEPAQILCNKDPMIAAKWQIVHAMFPNAKFVLMIRDGRAMIHSLMTRGKRLLNFNSTTQESAIMSWNTMMTKMIHECDAIGPELCMKVFYEQLVLHPERVTKEVFKFLNIEWTRDVLRHEEFVGKSGGISLSRFDMSTTQVIKPINTEALTKWVDWLEPAVKANLSVLAPLLVKLGYDIISDIPSYGEPDKIVLDNVHRIESNKDFWEEKEKSIVMSRSNDTVEKNIIMSRLNYNKQ